MYTYQQIQGVLCLQSGIGLADVVAEKQEPAAVPLNSSSLGTLQQRLNALQEQATSTLREQVRSRVFNRGKRPLCRAGTHLQRLVDKHQSRRAAGHASWSCCRTNLAPPCMLRVSISKSHRKDVAAQPCSATMLRFWFRSQGFKEDQIGVERYLNLRYDGTDVPVMTPCPVRGGDAAKAFEEQYKREFGFVLSVRIGLTHMLCMTCTLVPACSDVEVGPANLHWCSSCARCLNHVQQHVLQQPKPSSCLSFNIPFPIFQDRDIIVDDVRVRATGRSVELPMAGSIDKDPGKQKESERNIKSVFTHQFQYC